MKRILFAVIIIISVVLTFPDNGVTRIDKKACLKAIHDLKKSGTITSYSIERKRGFVEIKKNAFVHLGLETIFGLSKCFYDNYSEAVAWKLFIVDADNPDSVKGLLVLFACKRKDGYIVWELTNYITKEHYKSKYRFGI